MKKITLGALMALIVVSLGVVLWNNASVKTTSPNQTARNMIKALSQPNEAALQQTFCDPNLALLVFPSPIMQLNFSALTYHEQNEQDETRVITVTGHIQTITESITHPFSWALHMEKQDSNWCIISLESTN